MRHVIVGGGIAGTTAAEELRKFRPNDEITIVSGEQHPIYSRVLLPHYLKGKVPRERVFLKKEAWYAEQDIEWLPGLSVSAVDPKNAFVSLSDGRELPYDKLLIATGGEVRTVPDDVRGVSYLRTLDDADHLLQLLGELPARARAGIYGGGFIACEYLNLFAHVGFPTTVAFRGPHFWSRVLDAESGKLLNDHLVAHDVEIVPEAGFVGATGDKVLQGMQLRPFPLRPLSPEPVEGGTVSRPSTHSIPQGRPEDIRRTTGSGNKLISCSILGIGVGIEPDLSWIRNAGIEVGSGVLTNDCLETNIPNIYVAGDVAEFFDAIVGRRLMIGTWLTAMTHGRTVARSMAGERTPFKLVSSYATNALGLEIIFVGDTSREAADRIVVRGSAKAGGVTQLFVRGGRLVGATIIGRNTDRPPITKLIQEQREIADFAEKWSDPSVPIIS